MFPLLQMKQNKQSAPYWRVSLLNLCRMVNGLRQESWSSEEEEDSELREGSLQLLEELYNLQHICRALQSREERVRHTHTSTHPQTHTQTLLLQYKDLQSHSVKKLSFVKFVTCIFAFIWIIL